MAIKFNVKGFECCRRGSFTPVAGLAGTDVHLLLFLAALSSKMTCTLFVTFCMKRLIVEDAINFKPALSPQRINVDSS